MNLQRRTLWISFNMTTIGVARVTEKKSCSEVISKSVTPIGEATWLAVDNASNFAVRECVNEL